MDRINSDSGKIEIELMETNQEQLKMDSEAIVKGLIAEYVKPKYPIYKVYYTAALIPDCSCELIIRRKNKIVEVMPEKTEDCFFEEGKIHIEVVTMYDQYGVVHIDASEHDRELFGEFDPQELTYIIYKIERLA